MCAVSVISDWGSKVPREQWTIPAFNQFQKILRDVEILDQTLLQPDCEDPEKLKWIQEVKERLFKLEQKQVEKRLADLQKEIEGDGRFGSPA